jgi:hypothetical protein
MRDSETAVGTVSEATSVPEQRGESPRNLFPLYQLAQIPRASYRERYESTDDELAVERTLPDLRGEDA